MNNEMNNLEKRIDKLIGVCRTLKEENLHLRLKNEELRKDHMLLNEKTKMARNRLDSIANRLKDIKSGELV